jgi:hypothetical protein
LKKPIFFTKQRHLPTPVKPIVPIFIIVSVLIVVIASVSVIFIVSSVLLSFHWNRYGFLAGLLPIDFLIICKVVLRPVICPIS